MKLSKELKQAIVAEIRKDCREEARKILELTDDKERIEFLTYHKEDKGNICCLVLDFAKKKLIEAGKMELKETDCFKDPNDWLKD